MRLPLFGFFLVIVFIVALQRTCSKAARFQIVTEAEKELFQRRAAGVHRRPKRKLGQNERKGGKKVKKEKKRKKTFKKRQRLKNSRKKSKYKTSKKENKPKRRNKHFGATNPQRKGRTNTQSRSHKQNLLQHVLDIEEKTRGRMEEVNETLGESDFDSEPNESKDDITQFEKTQDNPVAMNTAKKEKKQKKKKKKQKLRKKKCKYTKKDLEAKNAKTCNRAKERARLSYRTMEMLFEQVYDESLIYSKVVKKERTYLLFFRAATAFVSNNTVCEGNPTWNSVLLNEKLAEFKEGIDELDHCFLGQVPTSDQVSEGFSPNTIGLSKSDRLDLENCLETQNKTERCKHCNNKCGEALKNGEVCVQRAVLLLEKARKSREKCQSHFRKLEKMQQRLVHDMYRWHHMFRY